MHSEQRTTCFSQRAPQEEHVLDVSDEMDATAAACRLLREANASCSCWSREGFGKAGCGDQEEASELPTEDQHAGEMREEEPTAAWMGGDGSRESVWLAAATVGSTSAAAAAFVRRQPADDDTESGSSGRISGRR